MFACLVIQKKEARPLWERRRNVPPVLARVNVPCGAPFFCLTAAPGKGGALPWPEIERAAGRLRTKMLFPAGVLPPESGLRAFVPRRLPLLLSLRAAQQALRESAVPVRERSVTVIDTRGVLVRAVESLVPLAGSLRVFTHNFTPYRAVAENLQQRYGVTLVLSDAAACFAQSQVVVADSLQQLTGLERGLIFTPDDAPAPPGLRVLRCAVPQLPAPCGALLPAGIDALQFASALYELCGVKEMERLTEHSCSCVNA